ncbi:serine/threonine protein kinase [Spiroplasma sp. TIUS-1]|uniref:serine/threonine-protein kinase n=1 Tax=Spiroplasma sp. TIUS-1 TaxID=216963 RepID=UPI001398BB52|nr:serine/threonine-protein kinase [Spiroplasma sp. TIUS-1]QHX35769.1 serine/threonine protein kinase [Spiroplasma sp. TIUS-1]
MESKSNTEKTDIFNLSKGEVFDGRYVIVKKIGSGGFGSVYEVFDNINKQTLAIKFVKSDESRADLAIERFLVEKESFANLSINPYVIKLYDVFQEDKTWAIVTEIVSGGSLSEFNKRFFYMNQDEIKLFYTRVCSALSDAHKLNIIHRDIKEGNIMLTKFGSPKLGDFGISYTEHSTDLTKDVKVGTPTHLDPQYFKWGAISKQGDVYQLGICLYTSAVGEPPFWIHNSKWQGSKKATWYKLNQCRVNPVRPSLINPNVSIELENIILKALDKNLSRRYKNMDDMQNDIQNLGTNPNAKPFKSSTRWDKSEFFAEMKSYKKERNIIEVGVVNSSSMKSSFVFSLLAIFLVTILTFIIMVMIYV